MSKSKAEVSTMTFNVKMSSRIDPAEGQPDTPFEQLKPTPLTLTLSEADGNEFTAKMGALLGEYTRKAVR